jgi:two-component system NtrC family sensor kinase
MGDLNEFDQRDYNFPSFIFNLNIPAGESVEYYIRVKNHEQQQLPLYVGTYHDIINKNISNETIIAIYMGIVLVMFLYNLFLFFSIRDRSYGLYVGYILTIGITQIALLGYAYKFLWPHSVWLQNNATYIFSSLSGIVIILFVQEFLKTKTVVPKLSRAMDFVTGGYILCIPIACVLRQYILGYYMLQLLAMGGSFLIITTAIIAFRKNVASAKYFLAAWIMFLIGVIIFVCKDYNIIPYNTLSLYTLPAGSAVELVLISFALANRINILKKEKEESQLLALKAAEENERLVREQNIILDAEVKERTKDLQAAMHELKRSEVELVNREKMSSLGLLTAGIAHEINNPINFVSASVTPLKRDIHDILGLLNEYDTLKVNNFSPEKFDEIQSMKEALDTTFIVDEINMLLNGIEEGAVRTANIVRGLQKFSRSDEHFMKNADLIDGIENTLTLLSTQIKDQITIERDYQPIPFLDCSPGKLNQVFLNILSNAIYAVQNANKKQKVITISTFMKENVIHISIRDNGIGIPKEEHEKIFDPFYTTKEVGKGTGLGLSISYGIIKDHKGEIAVESTPGEGAEFILKLPILT